MVRKEKSDVSVDDDLGYTGGTNEFWWYFRVGLVAPLVSILWQYTVRRKRHSKACIAGTQCGSATSLFFCGVISTIILLFTLTPSAPHGIAVIPILASGIFAPSLFYFGTFSYLTLHGRHQRSSLHIILSVGSALASLATLLFVILYSVLSGMWTAM